MGNREDRKKNEGGRKFAGMRVLCGCPGLTPPPPHPAKGLGPRGASGAGSRSCPPGGGREREGIITGVVWVAFFFSDWLLSPPHPIHPIPPPAPPSRSLQDHFQGKARGAEDFPLFAPISFLPRAEGRSYLLLFSPSGRDNALIDTLFGKSRLVFLFRHR